MIQKISILFSLALAVALMAPAIASVADQGCQDHHIQSCHGVEGSSQEKESGATGHSHKCAIHHLCCHSPAYVSPAMAYANLTSSTTCLGAGYFFSVSSSILEGPFQPPEA